MDKLFESWRSFKTSINEVTMKYAEYGASFPEFAQLLESLSDKTWIFFDTETTGLKTDKPYSQITQIAAIAVDVKGFRPGEEPEVIDQLDARLNLARGTTDFMAWERSKAGAFEKEKMEKIRAAREAGVEVPASEEMKAALGVSKVKRIKPPSKYSLYRPISANLSMTGYGVSPNIEKRRKKEFLQQVEQNPELKLSDVQPEKVEFFTGPEAMKLFKEFLDKYPNRVMVAQNAPFDDRFIEAMNKRVGVPTVPDAIFDTVPVFKKFLVPALKKFQASIAAGEELSDEDKKILKNLTNPATGKLTVSLGKLIKAFDVKNKGWHNALSDVLMLLDVLRAVVHFLSRREDLASLPPEPEEVRRGKGKPSDIR